MPPCSILCLPGESRFPSPETGPMHNKQRSSTSIKVMKVTPHRHDQRHISQVFLGSLKLKIDIDIRFIQRKSKMKSSQTLLKKKQQKNHEEAETLLCNSFYEGGITLIPILYLQSSTKKENYKSTFP